MIRLIAVAICLAAAPALAFSFGGAKWSSASTATATTTTTLNNNEEQPGAGGMFDTRNPDSYEDEDARKSISAAPSFEEYLKMREGSTDVAVEANAPAPVATVTVTSSTPVPPTPVQQQQRPADAGGGGGNDAIAFLELSQATIIDKIASEISDLVPKPDFTWTANIDGCSTKVDARDAIGNANVAWLCGVSMDTKMSSLTIYNGPLSDVPHLTSKCIISGDQLQFKLDFRPRCYGAYEMQREDGTYPGPDELGRKSFEYSGARKEFESKFGNEEMKEWLSSMMDSFQGLEEYDPDKSEFDELIRGPLFTSVTMPNTEANVAAIIVAREKAANFWLAWMKDGQHEHRPGAPVNTQYVYDSKFKLNAYSALLDEYSKIYGSDEGKKLAVGESGPLDEAYVGGGS